MLKLNSGFRDYDHRDVGWLVASPNLTRLAERPKEALGSIQNVHYALFAQSGTRLGDVSITLPFHFWFSAQTVAIPTAGEDL
jgi:hypothetical protein